MKHLYLDLLLIRRPLRDVFWFYGVIPGSLLWLMALFLHFNGAPLATELLMFALIGCYTVWIIAEIWLCADSVDNPVYSDIARMLTAAWALNSVLLMLFLLLQRIGAP